MTKKEELQVIKKAVQINLDLIQNLLSDDKAINKKVMKLTPWGCYGARNRKNTELRQRMKALRKDMIRLEKLMEEVAE